MTQARPESRPNLARTVSRNILAAYLSRGVTLLAPLVLIPLYTRWLGTRVYGEWVVILSLTSYLGLASLGTWQAVGNRTAASFAVERWKDVGQILSTAFLSYAVLSACLAGVIWVLAGPIIVHLLPQAGASVAPALAIYASLSLLSWGPRTYAMALRSYERVDAQQTAGAASELIRVAAIAAALLAGFKLLAVAAIQGGALMVYGLGCWWWARRLGPEMRLRLGSFSSRLLRSLLRPSLGFFVLDFAYAINFGVDNLVIGYALGAEAVTRYSVPMRLVMIGASLFEMGVSTLRPTITVHYSRGDHQRLAYGFLFAMRLAVLWGSAGLIGLWLLGSAFLGLWAGPGVFPGSLAFGLQLALFALLVSMFPAQQILVATTRHYQFAKLSIIEGVLNLSLSLWWVRYFGLAGVIGGTVAARLLTNAWYVPFFALKTLDVRAITLLRELAPALTVAAAALSATVALSRISIVHREAALMIGLTVLMLGAFAAAFWRIGLTARDRATAARLAGASLGRHRRPDRAEPGVRSATPRAACAVGDMSRSVAQEDLKEPGAGR